MKVLPVLLLLSLTLAKQEEIVCDLRIEMVNVTEQLTVTEEELMESKEDFKRTKSELNRILAWADEVNKRTDMLKEALANMKDDLRLQTIETKVMNIKVSLSVFLWSQHGSAAHHLQNHPIHH